MLGRLGFAKLRDLPLVSAFQVGRHTPRIVMLLFRLLQAQIVRGSLVPGPKRRFPPISSRRSAGIFGWFASPYAAVADDTAGPGPATRGKRSGSTVNSSQFLLKVRSALAYPASMLDLPARG
jgi:hypothetical protein